jgi:16S rRNA (uracil1498-N3)-methyltransferase
VPVKAPRFFYEGLLAPDSIVTLRGSDARKIRAVLRMRDGDEIELFDSAAQRFRARLMLDDRAVTARVVEVYPQQLRAPLRITVAQAVPKGAKMDFIVEKLTELGVAAIVPMNSERSIGRVSESKIERWRRLARSAAAQCGRADVPPVAEPAQFSHVVESSGGYDRFIMPWELSEARPLRELLPELLRDARTALIAIGPEGGFSHAEADAAEATGAQLVSLGRRILRTETAALALVAMMNLVTDA